MQENGGQTEPPGRSAFDAIGAFAEAAARHADDPERRCVELCPICRTADVIRAGTPPELREQWHTLQREALTTLRALIDHYLESLERERPFAPAVEDIPVD